MTNPRFAVRNKMWEFYVYQVFRKRNDDQRRVRVFKTVAAGHLFAKDNALKNADSFSELIESNDLDFFFVCIKRGAFVEIELGDEIPTGSEFIGENEITAEQSNYFQRNRVIK